MEIYSIREFRGEYYFLSNFFESPVEFEGINYPAVEHAYQAAKTNNVGLRWKIAGCGRPARARELGREVPLREDWTDDFKIGVMTELVRLKFETHAWLKARLIATGNVELVEGNTWSDRFWGVCDGVGQNHLGRILMTTREQLRHTGTGGQSDACAEPRHG